MYVFIKKIGMFVLLGTLFTACSTKSQPTRVTVKPFSNVANIKRDKVCTTCVATLLKEKS